MVFVFQASVLFGFNWNGRKLTVHPKSNLQQCVTHWECIAKKVSHVMLRVLGINRYSYPIIDLRSFFCLRIRLWAQAWVQKTKAADLICISGTFLYRLYIYMIHVLHKEGTEITLVVFFKTGRSFFWCCRAERGTWVNFLLKMVYWSS